MAYKLKDKVALVTGGGRDIGRACALQCAREGARVAITYMASADGALEVCSEIEATGGEGIAIQADLTRPEEAQRVMERLHERFGGLDVLMHVSGGLIARKPLAEMDESFWRQVMDVNLTSLFLTARAALPVMREGGAIVTFSSQAARDGGGPGAVAYSTAKGAVMTFTRGLAKELGPQLRVNAVCPGMIDTSFHDRFTRAEVREKVAGGAPLKREGHAEEVASLAVYLASDEASYLTGACVDINGGTYFS